MPPPSQEELNEIQALYREWTRLMPQLEAAQQDWRCGEAIMRRLAQFYFNGGYRAAREAEEQGSQPDLRTEGEYSILSEDALWNAFHDQQTLAWQWLRAVIDTLDRDRGSGDSP